MNDGKELGIPRSLYITMALQFAVGGAVMPFVSMFLRDRGLDFPRISQVFLASSSTLLVFPFLWGMLADRVLPLNRLFLILNLLAAGALAMLSRQRSFWGMLMSFTIFYACFHPTLTLINALSFSHLRDPQAKFSGLRAWGSIGWMIPSLLIFLWLGGIRVADLGFALDLGVALALVTAGAACFLPHTPPGGRASSSLDSAGLEYWPAIKRLLRDRDYVTILIAFFLVTGSFSILMLYSPPFLEDLGVARAWIGPVQCTGVVLEIVLFRWLPGFIARWNYRACLLTGCLALLIRHLLFVISGDPWLLSASYLLAGVVIVFYHIAGSILVNTIAGIEVRASAQTLLVFFGSGMGPMFANWTAGQLAVRGSGSLRPVFLFAAILAGMACVLISIRGASLNRRAVRCL